MMISNKPKQQGFTIVELLIATSVFGVMMLLATTGMIHIGRAYYKGITTAKTQEIARSIEKEVTDTVRNGSDTAISPGSEPGLPAVSVPTSFGIEARCIGKTRYTYVIGVKVAGVNNITLGSRTIKHALWVDSLPSSSSPCNPVDLREDDPSEDTDLSWNAKASSDLSQRRDLLASNMRLTKFDLNPSGTTGVKLDLRVLYGDDDVFDTSDPSNTTCLPNRSGGQFCAFSEVGTFAERR